MGCGRVQRRHSSHPQMRQILQFGQVRQLQVQGIHDSPSVEREDANHGPNEHHQDVVGEDEVVDDGKEQEGKQPEHGEYGERPQPRKDLLLVLLKGFQNGIIIDAFDGIQKTNGKKCNKGVKCKAT